MVYSFFLNYSQYIHMETRCKHQAEFAIRKESLKIPFVLPCKIQWPELLSVLDSDSLLLGQEYCWMTGFFYCSMVSLAIVWQKYETEGYGSFMLLLYLCNNLTVITCCHFVEGTQNWESLGVLWSIQGDLSVSYILFVFLIYSDSINLLLF